MQFFSKLFEGDLNAEFTLPLIFIIAFCSWALICKIFHFRFFGLKPFHIVFMGAALSMGGVFWKIHSDVTVPFHRFFDSLLSTLKSFGFEYTPKELLEMLYKNTADEALTEPVDKTFLSVLSFFVASMTVIAALSIFRDTAAQLKYNLLWFTKAFIFSELNEKSICLAQDIRKKHRFARIVFMGVDRIGSDEAVQGLVLEAENIGAIMTRKSVLDFRYIFMPSIKFIKSEHNIYLIDLEESNNIKNGVELYRKSKNCTIHVFSTLESSESFIDGISKGGNNVVINLVNRAQIIAYDILMRYPLYRVADRFDKNISVLVVGAGTIGMEFAKAAMWCGVMNDYKFKIRILDTTDRESEFRMKYPYFDDELKNIGWNIDYKFGVVDVNSSDFNQMLGIYGDVNYIVIATGDDELNINVASRVRRYYLKKCIRDGVPTGDNKLIDFNEPFIIPVISNADYYHILDKSAPDSNLCPYGSHSNIYKSETVNEWPVDVFARGIHNQYNDEAKRRDPNAYTSEYDDNSQTIKRSNRTNAVHILYKLKDIGIDMRRSYIGKDDDLQKKEQADEAKMLAMGYKPLEDRETLFRYLNNNKKVLSDLCKLEHNRWCVFELLDGWASWSVDEVKKVYASKFNSNSCADEYDHKQKNALLHAAIVSNQNLPEVSKALKQDWHNLVDYDEIVTAYIWKKGDGFFDKVDSFIKNEKDYVLKIYYDPSMLSFDEK